MKMYTWLKATALAVALLACSFASAIPVEITVPDAESGTLTATYKVKDEEKPLPSDDFKGGYIFVTVTAKKTGEAALVSATITKKDDKDVAVNPTLERVGTEQKWVGQVYINPTSKKVVIKAEFKKGIKIEFESLADLEFKTTPKDLSLIYPKTLITVDITKVPAGKDITFTSSDTKVKVTDVMVNRVVDVQTDENDTKLTPSSTNAKPKFKVDIEVNKEKALEAMVVIPMIEEGGNLYYDFNDDHWVDPPFQANLGIVYSCLLLRKGDAEFVELSAKYKLQGGEEKKLGPYDLSTEVGKEKGFQWLLDDKSALAKGIPTKDKSGDLKWEYFTLSALLDYEESEDPQPDPGAAVADNAFAGVSVYPNPFQGQLVVKEVAAAERVLLLNAQGMVVRNLPVNGASELALDTENLPAGMYMVVVENAAARKVFKVVK